MGGTLRQGLHDLQYEITLPLSEDARTRLRLRWEGGLEVLPQIGGPQPGGRSAGIRILDFTQEGEDWILVLEGDGGSAEAVRLRGERVVTEDPEIQMGEGEPGITLLRVGFPETGRRETRRIRLARAR